MARWWLAQLFVGLGSLSIPPGFTISSFSSYDETFAFSLEDGCRYDAHIRGTLTPIFSRAGWSENVEPDFDISANLVCPAITNLHVEERLAHTGPLTRERVEALISQRATINQENSEHRCQLMPLIRFHGEGIVAEGIERRCTQTPL